MWPARRSTKSGSNRSSGRLPRWTTVTSAPARTATCANSIETYPPPTKRTRRGSAPQAEEVGARRDVLGAVERERGGAGAGGDQEVPEREPPLAVFGLDDDGVLGHQAGAAVERVDPLLLEPGLLRLGDRLGERPLERHEVGPVDADAAGRPVPLRPPGEVGDVGGPDEDLLGVAPAEGARAAVGEGVDDGDAPAGRGGLVGRGRGGGAGAEDDEVVGVGHAWVGVRRRSS